MFQNQIGVQSLGKCLLKKIHHTGKSHQVEMLPGNKTIFSTSKEHHATFSVFRYLLQQPTDYSRREWGLDEDMSTIKDFKSHQGEDSRYFQNRTDMQGNHFGTNLLFDQFKTV